MRDTLRLLGIIALAVIIGFSMVACDNGSTTESGDKTPVVGDYSISGDGNKTYTGEPIAVTVTAKGGASPGAVTVLYNGNPNAPKDTGSYAITINVAAASGWKAVDGLGGGWILIISNPGNKPKPTADDFEYSGREQTWTGEAKRLGITPKTGKSNGVLAIYYDGKPTEPIDVGTYTVTFDVAATDSYASADGLVATVPLTITPGVVATIPPVADDFIVIGKGNYPADGSMRWVYVIPKTGKSQGLPTVYYNGSKDAPTEIGQYHITFDVTASGPYTAAQGLDGGWLYIDGEKVIKDFFVVSGLSQVYDGQPKSVRVVPKADYQVLTAIVRYQAPGGVPVINAPYQVGEYDVTFDVPKAPGFLGDDGLVAGKLIIGPSTGSDAPLASSFTVLGLGNYTYDATMARVVSVEQSDRGGLITVLYQGSGGISDTAPKNAGTYDVSFNVGASTTNGSATMQLGKITINPVPPVLSDFTLENNITTYDGLTKRVDITSEKLGDIRPYLNIRYDGSPNEPVNAGKYNVTFNLSATSNWQAVSELPVGELEIRRGIPKLADFTYTLPAGKEYDGIKLADPVVTDNTGYPVHDGVKAYAFNGAASAVDAAEYEITLKLPITDNWEARDLTLEGKVTIEAKTPKNEDFKPVQGILLSQTAYSFTPDTFPNRLFEVDQSRTPHYPTTVNLPNVSWFIGTTSSNFVGVKNAGKGTYTIRMVVPAAPNWKGPTTLNYELTVGDIVFTTAAQFIEWYNARNAGATLQYRAKFSEASLPAADIGKITAALKGDGTSGTANNANKRIYLDLTKAFTGSPDLTQTANGFGGCQNLIGIDLTGTTIGGTNTINATTFSGCTNLREVILGPVTTLTGAVFADCPNLQILDTGAVTAITKANITLALPAGGTARTPIRELTLRSDTITTTTGTGDTLVAAFGELSNLQKLTVIGTAPIGEGAFKGCANLASVEFKAADYGATGDIGVSAFEACGNLASVTFPEAWAGDTGKGIQSKAFKGTKITNLVIPQLKTGTIADDAFEGVKLVTITLGNGTAADIGPTVLANGVFMNKKELTTVTLKTGVAVLPQSAFEGCSKLTTVNFPSPASTFTTIGSKAFKNCELLATDLPSGLIVSTGLGANAFENCKALRAVTIPAAVTEIAKGVFKGSGVTKVTFHSTFIAVRGGAGVADDGGFENCTSLVDVVYSSTGVTFTTIEEKAFAGCVSLKTFNNDSANDRGKFIIPASVVAPAVNAFKGCIGLTDVVIRPATTDAAAYKGETFSGCTNIVNLTFDGTVIHEDSVVGINFGDTGAGAPNKIPSVKVLNWNMMAGMASTTPPIIFTGLTGLEKLVVSKTLDPAAATIAAGTFSSSASNFKTLEIINQPQTTVTGAAFGGLPNTVTNVIVGALSPASGTTGIALGNGNNAMFNSRVNYIEFTSYIGTLTRAVFAGLGTTGASGPITVKINQNPGANFTGTTLSTDANVIGKLIIGDKTPLIAATAFTSTELKEIEVLPGNEKMGNNGDGVLYGKNDDGVLDKLILFPPKKTADSYTVASTVTIIGDSAFGIAAIKELTIPESVKEIQANALASLPNPAPNYNTLKIIYNAVNATNVTEFPATLSKLEIGERVKTIPAAFLGENGDVNGGITELTIPASVTDIGDGAFNTAKKIKTVVFKATDYRGVDIFKEVDTIESVTFGEGVKIIRSGMFDSVDKLVYVTLPASLTFIEENAFNACTALNRIRIPANVLTIGTGAFDGCTSLNEVIFVGSSTGFVEDGVFPAVSGDGTTLYSVYMENGLGWYVSDNNATLDERIWVYRSDKTTFN